MEGASLRLMTVSRELAIKLKTEGHAELLRDSYWSCLVGHLLESALRSLS